MKTIVDYKKDIMTLFENYNVRLENKLHSLTRELSSVFSTTVVDRINYAIQNSDREVIDDIFSAWS